MFEKHFINYHEIDQLHRCNSVLEAFYAGFNEIIGKNKSIQHFVTSLKTIENEKYQKLINFERRGIQKTTLSANFNKMYIPGPVKKVLSDLTLIQVMSSLTIRG